MVFGGINSEPLSLYNRGIPIVSQAKHFGHIFHTDETMERDLKQKPNEIRAGYFKILQELGDQSPFVFVFEVAADLHNPLIWLSSVGYL